MPIEKESKEPKVEPKSSKGLDSYKGLKEFIILKEFKGGHKKGAKPSLSYEVALIFKSKGLI